VDVTIAPSVVPVIVGLVVLALRLGLPALDVAPLAIMFSLVIFLGYVLASPVPDGTVVVDALLEGAAVGLTSAGPFWCRVGVRMEGGEMAVTRATLERLALPLNRGDFPTFVAAVERLPADDRNILAVLGAGELLCQAFSRNVLLREPAAHRLEGWLSQFKQEHVSRI
jgi:hypothetical protein